MRNIALSLHALMRGKQTELTEFFRQLPWSTRDPVALYFSRARPIYGLIPILAGIAIGEHIVGKALILLGLFWIGLTYWLGKASPSESEIDQFFSTQFDRLAMTAQESLHSSGLTGLPLVVQEPVSRTYDQLPLLMARTGADGLLRSPIVQALVLVPLEDRLGAYRCQFNLYTGTRQDTSIEEYHYRDIVSIKLRNIDTPRHPRDRMQILSISLSDGRILEIPTYPLTSIAASSERRAESLEQALKAVRVLMGTNQ